MFKAEERELLNRIIIIGRAVKDPELRYLPGNGTAVANFTLAVDRNYKNSQGERETDFLNCVAYRQLAEIVSEYLSKGKLASVDGRIQVRSYTAQDGGKRYVTEIIAEDVRVLSPKDKGQSSEYSFGHEVNFDDEDRPF